MTEPPVAVDEEWTSVPVESATEQLRALKPLVSRDAVQAHINAASELRAMGPAARHALSVSRSDSSSIEAVAKAIKQDQALSLKVLKLANSPLYSTGDRVETVAKAVARIGIAQIHEAVVSMSVMEEFGNASLASRIHSDWFWEHSIAVALIASRINHQRKGRVDNDSMFTAGLLHDLGRMLFATHLGESYATVLETADRLGLPLETIESRLLLVNHADLSDQLLRAWKFPPDLISPIALHHLSLGNIRRAAPRLVEEVSVLALANRLAHALLLGCSGNDAVYPLEEFLGALSLDGAQLAQLLADIPDQATDLKCGMFAAGSGAPGKSFLEDARSRLGVDMRPLPVALTPGTDSVAILAARLALQANGEPPNLAIVRVTTPRDRSPLMDLLKDSELRAGAQALPCLVVASTPNCLFAPGMLGQRRVEQVVVPLRLNRLFAAIRALLASVPQSQAA